MTQQFDFVALGWVEKYLREEMDTARSHLYAYQREPEEIRHLREALRNVHSATGVLRLCALDPAALLTQEIERVIGQLIVGRIAGEARKLAMTELAAAIEALPAYLANVRAKREVSAGVIANVINDLRHFGNRPALPDSLFFNPSIKPGAGITRGQHPAEDVKLKQFGARAMRICAKYSKPALKKERDALKQLYAIGKHATPLLAGSNLEPFFRCYMGFIEALAQPYMKSDEVVVDIFKYTFAVLKSLALTGSRSLEDVNPTPQVKKMLYYVAKTPSPTSLQKGVRETFDVHNVDDVGIASAGRLIQEDDLLEALNDTMNSLLSVMEFMTSQHRDIHAGNSVLVNSIVPQLRQVGLQLKALGLMTHAETINEQYEFLKKLSEADKPALQSELLDFGGALVAVKESLENKLKHGLSAEGDSMGHDLDSAIMAQTFRCLNDMKNSINRAFARSELQEVLAGGVAGGSASVVQMRPVHRAATLVDDSEIQAAITAWEQGELPSSEELLAMAERLLNVIPQNAYAEQAAADMEQVVSVLSLMDDKQREAQVLQLCIKFIRDSIALGGLVNDTGMACFAESIAALEQFMERRTEDPLGNAEDHLDRSEARARLLDSFIDQRKETAPPADNVLQFAGPKAPSASAPGEESDADSPEGEIGSELDASMEEVDPTSSVSIDLEEPEPHAGAMDAALAAREETAAPRLTATPSAGAGIFWRDALSRWAALEIDRGPDAPLENPDADIDEELVECFVEEARKYIRKLQDASPLFAEELDNEKYILDIRAVFHTMKGSSRTIELHEFGEFMYDMEKVFNAIRDGYIQGTPAIADLLDAVTVKLPVFIDLMMQRVPLYTADFNVPHQIAASISEKRFDADSMQVSMADVPGVAEASEDSETSSAAAVEDAAETEPLQSQAAVEPEPHMEAGQSEITDSGDVTVSDVEAASCEAIAEADAAAQAPDETAANTDREPPVPEQAPELSAVEQVTEPEEARQAADATGLDNDAPGPQAVEQPTDTPIAAQPADVDRSQSNAWNQGTADEIIETLGARLKDAQSVESDNSLGGGALILLSALIPALKELDESGQVNLDDAGLSQMLKLPTITSAVESADSGGLHPGDESAVECRLSRGSVEGLLRYLKTITPEGAETVDSAAHAELEHFIRRALDLALPEVENGQPDVDEAEDELQDIVLQEEPYGESDVFAKVNLVDIPITGPPPSDPGDIEEQLVEGDPLSPKPGGASEPDLSLGSESAAISEFASDLDAGETVEVEAPGAPVNYLDLDEDLSDLLTDKAAVAIDAQAAEPVPQDLEPRPDHAVSSAGLPSEDEVSLDEGDFSDIDEELFAREPLSDDPMGLVSDPLSDGALELLEEVADHEGAGDGAAASETQELLSSFLDEEELLDGVEGWSTGTVENAANSELHEEPQATVDEVSYLSSNEAPADLAEPVAETPVEATQEAKDATNGEPESEADAAPAAGVPEADAGRRETIPTPQVIEFPAVDIDMELLEIFLESVDDSVEVIDSAAAGLDSEQDQSVQRLKNTLHTLKGGANSIGLRNYGALVHEFESILLELEHTGALNTAEGKSAVYAQIDLLHDASNFVKQNEVDWSPDAQARREIEDTGNEAESEHQEADVSPAPAVESIRVATNKIDRLLDVGLEVSMSNVRTRRALDAAHQDRISVQTLARRVEEIVDKLSLQLDTEIQTKTEAMPAGETFDPLEMDRLTEKQGLAAILREAAFDLHEEAQGLGVHVANAMRETLASARLIEGTQAELRLLRLVNFARLGPGFRRLIHQTSRQLGKQVEFDLTCDDGGLDVSVFEKLKIALEHMLRNSVDHGIEMPEERQARGKSEVGKVSLIIYRQAAEFVIRLMDDGKGMASETLRRKAVESGILDEDERISEHEALQLIFHAGLSTAEKVTDISGRGVGMDVVQQSIAQIGGTIDVSSKPGFYTQFDIRIPASIMVNGALLATIGDEEVAVPLTSLDGSDFRPRDEVHLAAMDHGSRLSFRDEDYEVRYLGVVRGTLPIPPLEVMPDFVPVLFARYGRRRVAFFADSVTNAEELVIRSLGAQFTGVPGIAGGSLKSDGQPVLALDLNELIRQVDYADSLRDTAEAQSSDRIIVLCVDDSVMMRRTYQKRLASLDYQVVTAEDGEAALDYLAEATRLPDFIFTDLEMPNMNGFDFIQNMRRMPGMENVPTVVVSSRDADKHRAEARRVGATDFMAKGANSAEGMQDMIQRYLDAPAMAS